MKKPSVLLSFDTEEFDMPMEYGQQIPWEEQLGVCADGVDKLLLLLEAQNVNATFFVTGNFAEHESELTRKIALAHEIGSHTYYHSSFKNEDLLASRILLERITGKSVIGLRMPRMSYVDPLEVIKAGFLYDASINPTYLPGRYNNLGKPRTTFCEHGLLRIPATVSPIFRIPLFWLTFKNFPLALYKTLCKQALQKDGYICLYFHPWEFVDLSEYAIPGYTRRYSKELLLDRLDELISYLLKYAEFSTISEYLYQSGYLSITSKVTTQE